METETIQNLKRIASQIEAKQAVDTRIYDVSELSNVTAYLLITSALNNRHLEALCDDVLMYLRENRLTVIGREGVGDGSDWALVDCGEFVVHIFEPDSRSFYDLELIWGDAPQVKWNGDA